ncbi:MAG: hypothetical protein Kow0058_07650 [Roseovarius sp.]
MVAIAGVAVLALGALAWQMRAGPGADSPAGAVPANSAAGGGRDAAAQGRPIVRVTVPDSLSEAARTGQQIFAAKCARCHGPNAAGQEGVAPPLIHRIYEPSHHGDMAFLMAARNGARAHHWPFGDMPPVPDITDGEVKMVVRYIRELQRANGIE